MFDGTAIVADTKDAMKDNLDTDVEKHGMVAYLNAQPENVINSVRMAKDVINLLGRITFAFPPRRVVNPYNTDIYGDLDASDEQVCNFEPSGSISSGWSRIAYNLITLMDNWYLIDDTVSKDCCKA